MLHPLPGDRYYLCVVPAASTNALVDEVDDWAFAVVAVVSVDDLRSFITGDSDGFAEVWKVPTGAFGAFPQETGRRPASRRHGGGGGGGGRPARRKGRGNGGGGGGRGSGGGRSTSTGAPSDAPPSYASVTNTAGGDGAAGGGAGSAGPSSVSAAERRAQRVAAETPEAMADRAQTQCRYFAAGRCQRGAHCWYKHGDEGGSRYHL